MKKYYILLLLPMILLGQTGNFVKSTTYKQASLYTIANPTAGQARVDITYFDGLGRPIQQITSQASASGKDIVTPIEYDAFGRQVKEYLPYASAQNTAGYIDPATLITNLTTQYKTNYGTVNANPYSEKQLESSPLNRVLKQAAPGNDWSLAGSHTIKLAYQSNQSSDNVKLFTAATTWSASLDLYDITLGNAAGTTFYSANDLYKTITYDENTAAAPLEAAGSTVEFKNKTGQVVLKRTYDAGVNHDTYYVYDIYGNLTYVIPPKADAAITQAVLDNLCYQYKYDHRNRLVEKKLPGKQWEFIVYDKLDRVVATGPAASPFNDLTSVGWLITKYDILNRAVYTGWMTSTPATSTGRKTLQDAQNAPALAVISESKQTSGTIDGIAAYYSNTVAPVTFKLLTVNYYDNYTFPSSPAITIPANVEGQTTLTTAQVKGLSTASWSRVITTSTAVLGETNAVFYDAKARPVRNHLQNYSGGYTYTDSKLDSFSGQLQYSITRHKRLAADTELTTKDVFTYSPQDRLLTQTHQINGGTIELIASNTYDELGQLVSKKVGNTLSQPLQKADYTYNIRGWLTGINNTAALQVGTDPKDLFAFKINYNDTPGIATISPLYNGNIAETYWKTASEATPLERGYGYKYDNLNRLKTSIFKRNGTVNNAYDENLTYDKNGNIGSIIRNGNNETAANQIDNLAYTYQSTASNQLAKVVDTAPAAYKINGFADSAANVNDDYSYDANGNMLTDANKNITAITYNHLNLPTKITFGSTGNIVYIYNAAGQKLGKIVTQGTTVTSTLYLGVYQYLQPYLGTWALQFFPTAEGYVEPSGSSYTYVYQYKDHLGNIRLGYKNTGTTTSPILQIAEENNYYPFGLKQMGYNGVKNGVENKYKYNSQEFQDELGLGMTAMDWRQYDNALGRFINIDPLAEVFVDVSPFAFGFDNPVVFSDPTGLCPQCPSGATNGQVYNSTGGGTYIYNNGQWTRQDGELKEVVVTSAPKKKKEAKSEGQAGKPIVEEKTLLFGLIRNPNLNSRGQSPLEAYREHRDYSMYHEGETWLDRWARGINSVHMDVMFDYGSGGYNMYGGYGKAFSPTAFAEEVVNLNKATEGGGVRGLGTINSVVESSMYYSSEAEQGASIMRSIIKNHTFFDGNKRTAIAAIKLFAQQRGFKTVGNEALWRVAMKIESNQLTDVAEIAKLITK